MINIPGSMYQMPICIERQAKPAHCYALEDSNEESDTERWYIDVRRYLAYFEYAVNSST